MNTSIKTILALMVLVATFLSCNQGPSLQTYYVDNEIKPGFTSLDIPTSFLNIDENMLTEEQLEAYNSVDKLNMLGFVVDEDNREEYEVELQKVTEILKDPKYQDLMRGGNAVDGKFVVKFIGEEDEIDELILFGSANDKGFAVIRVLGDNMNPSKLMSLQNIMENQDFNDSVMNQISDIFK